MSFPIYYPDVASSYVESSVLVDANQAVGYKWYQEPSFLGTNSTNSYQFDAYTPTPSSPYNYSPVEYRPPEPPPQSPHLYYPSHYPDVTPNSPVYPSSFTCVDTPPIYMYSSPCQETTPPNTPQFATPTMSHSPTIQTEVAPMLFDENPVRRTDSLVDNVNEGATSVTWNQWEETLTKIIALIDRMQDDLKDRSTFNDKMVQGKSIEVDDDDTLPPHSEDISTKLVSPLSQTNYAHNESVFSVELHDLSLVETQNLESENDKIVYKLHGNEVVSSDGIYFSDNGIKLLEMEGKNSRIVSFLNESGDMEKIGEEDINVENITAFQSTDGDSNFIKVDCKEGEVKNEQPYEQSLLVNNVEMVRKELLNVLEKMPKEEGIPEVNALVLSLVKNENMSSGYSLKGRVNDAGSPSDRRTFRDGKKSEIITLMLLIMEQLLKEHPELRRVSAIISIFDPGGGLSYCQDIFQLLYILEDNDTLRERILRLLGASDENFQQSCHSIIKLNVMLKATKMWVAFDTAGSALCNVTRSDLLSGAMFGDKYYWFLIVGGFSYAEEDTKEKSSVYKREMINRAIHAAARGGNLMILKELLGDCCDALAFRDVQGSTILHTTAGRGQVEVVKDLVASFDIIDCSVNQGNTALHVAAYKGQSTAVEALLLASPSKMYSRNNNGQTFLHMAVTGFQTYNFRRVDHQIVLMKQLVSGKVVNIEEIINAKNNEGRTALHLAIIGKVHTDIVELLMSISSIDVNVCDNNSMTPLDLLKQRPHSASLELLTTQLISAGGVFSCQDYSARRVMASHLRMRSSGFSPGTSFKIPDAELFSHIGIGERGTRTKFDGIVSARLSTDPEEMRKSDFVMESHSPKNSTKQSSVNDTALHLKRLLGWPKMKKKKPEILQKTIDEISMSSSEEIPISLRQRNSQRSSLPTTRTTSNIYLGADYTKVDGFQLGGSFVHSSQFVIPAVKRMASTGYFTAIITIFDPGGYGCYQVLFQNAILEDKNIFKRDGL